MLFSNLIKYFVKLEETPSRNRMTEILAELFKAAGANEIDKICYLLQGRVVPLYEALEFGIADKFMIRAIAQAHDILEEKVKQTFKRSGDLGTAAQNCYQTRERNDKKLSVSAVYQRLYQLTQTSGAGSQERKIGFLANLLKSVDPLSVRYIVRIPLDKLRLGFSDMTMLDALSWVLTGDKSLREKLEDAYNVRPDLGYIAKTVKEKGISGLNDIKAEVGVPILASLCQRLPNVDEMIKKMGKVAVEPKYDGERVQIHYKQSAFSHQTSDRVRTFSRNLEDTTAMFPELRKIGEQLNAHEAILDSEAVGMDPKTGKLISFQTTMTRKRKHEIAQAVQNVPLKFFVFDILYRDGVDLIAKPLFERRAMLEKTLRQAHGKLLMISPQVVTDNPQQLRKYHDEQLKKGLEGAVVKKWNSPYEPGRRGYSWVKFKEEEGKTGKLSDTIDAVVMGYSGGEGRRADFGIGKFLVGVKRGEDFVTLTKIGTGVSDELWRRLRKSLNKIRISQMPKEYKEVNKIFIPDVWVAPKLVVEIAGDDLTKSPAHGAGFAVRFPRLVRIREDKSPREATTVSEIKTMYHNQGARK